MHLLHSSIDVVTYCAIAAFAYLQSQARAGRYRQDKKIRMMSMAVASTHTAVKNAPAFGFGAVLENAKTRFVRYRMYRQTVNELSALSNHELADLGLHRSMIRRVALQAANEQTAR